MLSGSLTVESCPNDVIIFVVKNDTKFLTKNPSDEKRIFTGFVLQKYCPFGVNIPTATGDAMAPPGQFLKFFIAFTKLLFEYSQQRYNIKSRYANISFCNNIF
jgi:hypothetical protein